MTDDLNPLADLLTLMAVFQTLEDQIQKQHAYNQLTGILTPIVDYGPDISRQLGNLAQQMAQFTLDKRSDLSPDEQLQLAFDYFNTAAEHYEQAIARSGADAQYNDCSAASMESLAWLYEHGTIRDGERNSVRARELRIEAAGRGNPDAQLNLGIMWYRGEGGILSKHAALRCLKETARNVKASPEKRQEARRYADQVAAELGMAIEPPARPATGRRRAELKPESSAS